jgi:integrase
MLISNKYVNMQVFGGLRAFTYYFVKSGGHILTLQKILGHSKIEMTMRYAHLLLDHLEDALTLNPKSQMDKKVVIVVFKSLKF